MDKWVDELLNEWINEFFIRVIDMVYVILVEGKSKINN